MIRDLFFLIKMVIITVVVVMVAQVRVGQKPLEDHFHDWVKSSVFVDAIQEAIDGGVAITKASYKVGDQKVHGWLAKIHSKHPHGDRGFHFNLKRFNEDKDDDGDIEVPAAKVHVPQAKAQAK